MKLNLVFALQLQGYEAIVLKKRFTPGMGSFCVAFENAEDAIGWCTEVQNELLKVSWPESLAKHLTVDQNRNDEEQQQEIALMPEVLENPAKIGPKMDHAIIPGENDRMSQTAKQKDDDEALRKGIRVRMGVHLEKSSSFVVDPITRTHAHNGTDVNVVACMATLAHGGQVIFCALTRLIFFLSFLFFSFCFSIFLCCFIRCWSQAM